MVGNTVPSRIIIIAIPLIIRSGALAVGTEPA